jgi:hypothetical protein
VFVVNLKKILGIK